MAAATRSSAGPAALAAALVSVLGGCALGSAGDATRPPGTATAPTVAPEPVPPTVPPVTVTVAPTATAEPVAPTVTPATVPPNPPEAGSSPTFDVATAAFGQLSDQNAAAALSVWRDGVPVLQLAAGADRSGAPVTTETPMVIASVGKLVTALTVARLAEAGLIDVHAPVPWGELGLEPHLGWHDVSVRELLDHTSGMPIVRQHWLDDPGPCSIPLGEVMAREPSPDRGRWVYSNGNYCALGLLVEAVTAARHDVAARRFVFGPAGVAGPRLTVDGPLPSDAPYDRGVARFDRLGAAGSWLAGTDHVAAVLATVTRRDRETLRWPGIFVDQYGWGHTGSVLGAVACAWVIEEGRTVVAAAVAGDRPSRGGGVCDLVVPAVSSDIGLAERDRPDRSPP